MSASLIRVDSAPEEPRFTLTQAQIILRWMVLDSVQSIHSKRNYAKALDSVCVLCQPTALSCSSNGISDDDGSPFSIDY